MTLYIQFLFQFQSIYVFVFENTLLKLSSELIKLYKKDVKLNLFYYLPFLIKN